MKVSTHFLAILAFATTALFTITKISQAQEVDYITDIRDGQRYRVVKIGDQWWTAENLKAAKYLNNDPIPTGYSDGDWTNLTTGAYAIYPYADIDGLNSESEVLEAYGALYNWYAVEDSRGLCPVGWEVPSGDEWTALKDFAGGESVAGGKLKSTRTEPDAHPRWGTPNEGATDEFGFTGIPGGQRNFDSYYGGIGSNGSWWSKTYSDFEPFATHSILYQMGTNIDIYQYSMNFGFSIRCLMSNELNGSLNYLILSNENFKVINNIELTKENASKKLYLINQGAEAVTITGITTSTPEFSVDIAPLTLAAGDSVHFTVTFNATQPGEYADQLVIESNDPYTPTIIIPISAFNATTACGVISESTTWTKANSPYHLQDCNVAVAEGVTLTIEPGVTVIIDPTRQFSVDGTLIAHGAEGDSITFRDNAGNGFNQLYFRSGSNVEMSYFRISGAQTGIRSESNTLSLAHGRITGGTTGVSLSEAVATINNVEFSRCQENAIYAAQSGLTLTNSVLRDNYRAINAIGDTYGRIDGCTIKNSTATTEPGYQIASGIDLSTNQPFEIINNTFINNTSNAVLVNFEMAEEPLNLRNISNNTFTGNFNAANITDSKFTDNYIQNGLSNGITAINSNIQNNIISNNGGYGIQVSSSTLSGNEVTGNTGNGINASNSTLTNNIVTNNGGIGINATGYNAISNCTITGNTGDGIRDEGSSNIQHCDIIDNGGDGIEANSIPTLNYSNIHGNTGYNINTTVPGSETINATNNYWGTTSTTEIDAKIYDYYDDGVNVKVNYTPFAQQAVQFPKVVSTEVSEITFTFALITASVNPNNLETSVYIEYGLTSEYSTTLPTTPATLTGSDNQTVTLELTDLTLGTRYHYRIKAVNASGTTYSEPQTFTTTFHYITDIRDGQRYRVVKIGDQWWTGENLKATKYLNNDPIPTGLDNTQWTETTEGAYSIYPHTAIDGLNSDAEVLEAYGALYNWYATDDSRGLCPVGWKVPSDEEWTILTDFAGGESVAGGKFKSTRTVSVAHPRWDNPNEGATDEFGFSAHPGGSRFDLDGTFYGMGIYGGWWSRTESEDMLAWVRYIFNDNLYVNRTDNNNSNGVTIRCNKDIELFGQFAYLTTTGENFEPVSTIELTNENANKKLYLINQGGEAVTITGITTSTPEFTVDIAPLTLAAGDSVHFTVSFSLAEAGEFAGNLVVESNDPFTPSITIPLTGKASLIVSSSVADITPTSAEISATINPFGIETTVTVEYGTTTDYGQTATTTPTTVSGNENQTVIAALTGLEAGTTYHYQIKAVNASATSYSEPQTFTTAFHYITDIRDGQRYRVVKIGNQWWTAENLKAAKYLNNDPIPTGLDNTQWSETTTGAYAIYPHTQIDGLNSDAEVLEAYGALYNWYAADDERGLCPVGWKVPSDEEWTELIGYVVEQGYPNESENTSGAGNALKSCRQENSPLGGECSTSEHPRWYSVETNSHYGFDEFGFSALPGGYRSQGDGYFYNVGSNGYWWSSSQLDATYAWGQSICYYYGSVSGRIEINKSDGVSVRCVKEKQFAYLTISDENFESVSTIELTKENANKKLYLINQGGEAATITGITTSTPEFSVDFEPLTLAAGDSVHFTATFNTSETGFYEDILTIESDDPFQPNITIPISGFNATTVCGVISENTIWTKENSPYHLKDCNVAVAAGVTLTIEPGVTVIIDPTRQLSVDGRLIAHGAEGDSITFRDNGSNGFNQLYFRSGSNVEMSYFRISGAETGIRSESSNINISNSRINNCHIGLVANGGETIVEHLTISNCSAGVIAENSAYVGFSNSTISNSFTGFTGKESSSGYITGSSFINILADPATVGLAEGGVVTLYSGASFEITGNFFEGNLDTSLYIENNANKAIKNNLIKNNEQAAAIKYALFSDNIIENNTSNGLSAEYVTIVSNTIIGNAGYGILANNSTLSGNEVTGNTGNGINASNSTLINNIITNNGGIGISATGYNDINYCTISGNSGEGILDVNGGNIQHCDIIDNGSYGIETSGLPTINYSNIHGNTGYNVIVSLQGSETIDATNNYWGTTSSTEIAAKVYDYYDDGVSVKVNYTPFAEQAVQFPKVVSTDVSEITFTSALITAAVNPNNLETSVYIEYGLTSEYGTTLPTTPAALTGSDNQTVTLELTDLTLGTRYHYRIKAVNASGTTYSEPQTFTTTFHYITDIRDGQRYRVVKINNQIWLGEDLKATEYLNDEAIDKNLSSQEWSNSKTGAYVVYPYANISNLSSDVEVINFYGVLYNWYAIEDPRRICPIGWKVPNQNDWNEIAEFAGGYSLAGGKLKSIKVYPDSDPYWTNPNQEATDEYGFSAFAGGALVPGDYYFTNIHNYGHWWSSSDNSISSTFSVYMYHNNSILYTASYDKSFGFSVRCIRDIEQFGQFAYLTISGENFEPINTIELTSENASKKLYLINQGGEVVNITGITTSTPEFMVDIAPLTLAAGDSVHLTVNFSTSQAGVFEDNLVIESNDPFTPSITIPLTGKASLIVSSSVADITPTSAEISATINPFGSETSVTVEYGTTSEYGQTATTTPSTVSGNENQTVIAALTGLEAGTTYHYRIKAVNVSATSYSEPQTFTTAFHYITDIRDGQRYRVTKIGDQWWTAENLKAAKYLNNDLIPTGLDYTQWSETTEGAYAIYPHTDIDGLNSNAEVLEAYGALYNWYAVDDSRGLCPLGWYMPSESDWTSLIEYAGGLSIAGGKLKSTRTEPDAHPRWGSPNLGATDYYGFSAFPASMMVDGNFSDDYCSTTSYWWSISESANSALFCHVRTQLEDVQLQYSDKMRGLSVRCIRDIELFGQFSYLTISNEDFKPVSTIELTNENANKKLYLINQGGEAVTITGITTSTPEFSVDITPLTLAAGDSVHLTVNFNAAEYGVYEGTLTIESNDPFVPVHTFALAGEKKYYSPLATEKPATEVTDNSAVLNATVNPYGEDAQVWFQWGNTETYQSSWQTLNATPSNLSGTTSTNVSASISSLLPNTTYYFRIKVTNSYETVYSGIGSLTTLAKLPTITTLSVSNNTNTQATLNGRVTPHNSSTTVVFRYGSTTSVTDEWTTVDVSGTFDGNSPIDVAADISGLTSHTQYYFVVQATNQAGTSTGEVVGFNTSAPIVNLQTASNVDLNSARLNATVNPNGYTTTYYFEYGLQPDLSDAISTSEGSLNAGSQAVAVNADIAGLEINTVYFFRLVASSINGEGISNIGELHTQCNFNIICTKPTGETAICQGSSTSQYQTTSTTALDYLWWVEPTTAGSITGTGTTGTITWNPDFLGEASIYVRGFNGTCTSVDSEPLLVMVNPNPEPNTISGNEAVCPGSYGNVYTVNGIAGNEYQWTVSGGDILDGQNTHSIRVDWGTASGTYGIEVTERVTSTGCENSNSKEVSISGALAPSNPEIRSKGRINILFSSVNASSYQWFENNEPISNATKKFYVARSASGIIMLRITEGNCSAFSNPVNLAKGLNEVDWESMMSLYPNPSKGLINVDVFGEINGLMDLRVSDGNGRQVFLKKVFKGDYYHTEQINIPMPIPGIYYIEAIINGEIIDSEKVIIQ